MQNVRDALQNIDGLSWIMLAFAGLGMVANADTVTLTLSDGRSVAAISYDRQSGTPIQKAAELLAHDLTQLTGRSPALGDDLKSAQGNGVIGSQQQLAAAADFHLHWRFA